MKYIIFPILYERVLVWDHLHWFFLLQLDLCICVTWDCVLYLSQLFSLLNYLVFFCNLMGLLVISLEILYSFIMFDARGFPFGWYFDLITIVSCHHLVNLDILELFGFLQASFQPIIMFFLNNTSSFNSFNFTISIGVLLLDPSYYTLIHFTKPVPSSSVAHVELLIFRRLFFCGWFLFVFPSLFFRVIV